MKSTVLLSSSSREGASVPVLELPREGKEGLSPGGGEEMPPSPSCYKLERKKSRVFFRKASRKVAKKFTSVTV